jgi:hypothetical protein
VKAVTRRWLLAAATSSVAALVWRIDQRRARPPLLRSLVERDYDVRRLVNVRGWLVSATEARFFGSEI